MPRLPGQIVDLHQRRIFAGVVGWDEGRIVLIPEDRSVRESALLRRDVWTRTSHDRRRAEDWQARGRSCPSSIAHDSHNIVAIGADDASLCAAVNLVIKSRGGISVAGDGGQMVLALPIAGLMSDADGRDVARRYTALDLLAKQLCSRLDAPFMTLSFMALLVIPELKVSDRGLFLASRWNFVALTQ